jgi:ADP-ribose pyrophosphatase YjhB (NUDIX family)
VGGGDGVTGPDLRRLLDHGAHEELRGFIDGAPGWLAASLNFCSRCGTRLTYGPVPGDHRERAACPACGFIAYVNPRLVVTTIPITDDGDVVLLRRAIEPGYGAWAQPGGFLEADETAIQGAIRETREEVGLEVEPTRIVGLYSRPQASIVVVAFEAVIVGGSMTVTPEALEVRTYAPGAIPWAEVAFDTSVWALSDWLRSTHPGLARDLPAEPPAAGRHRG